MASVASNGAGVGVSRWTRLIPVAIIVYIISFMDRTNIGFAFGGMGADLHITKTQEGIAGGIFFIGYLFLQIPGGHLAERWSAKKFVGIMILVWGVFAVLSGFVNSYWELVVVRFFLGIAEGGIWPAILVLISHWFPMSERARAYGVWMMNIAISSIITAPLSGWILSLSDWRMLFIVEGIFPFVIAAPLWWWLVADRPAEAKWVSPGEREYIETALAKDHAERSASGTSIGAERSASGTTIGAEGGGDEFAGFGAVFRSGVVWRLVAVYFLIQVGFYGLNLWLPTLVKATTGGGSVEVGLVTAIPYVFAIVGLYVNARAADRNRRYAFHVMLPMAIAAVALVASVALGHLAVLSILLVSVAMGGALAYDGPFWASASRAMPVALAGGAMGLINALGNLGGFLGPSIGGKLQDVSGGSFFSTSLVLGAALLLAGLVMLTVRGRANPGRPVATTTTEGAGS